MDRRSASASPQSRAVPPLPTSLSKRRVAPLSLLEASSSGPRISLQRNRNTSSPAPAYGAPPPKATPTSSVHDGPRFTPLPRKSSASSLVSALSQGSVGGPQGGLDEETRLRWHIMKGELKTLLGSQYTQLSSDKISKLIRWKMAGPVLHGIDRPLDEPKTPESLSIAVPSPPSLETPMVVESVDVASEIGDVSTTSPNGADSTPGGILNERRMPYSRATRIKLEVFELQINSLAGEVLAILDDVRATWSRTDILDALNKQSPLPEDSFYKLTYNNVLLSGDRTLGDCDHKIVHKGYYVRPSVVAVVIPNTEKIVLQQALEAVLSLEPHLVREVSSMKTPPKGVLLTVQALGSLFHVQPTKVRVREGCFKPDYWTPTIRALFKSRDVLSSRLKGFDMDRDPTATTQKLAPFVQDASFNLEEIGRASVCCRRIAEWCSCLYRYCHAFA